MVDYTLTPNKSLIKPNRGTYVDSWDTPINNDWDYIDRALGGKYTVPTTAGTINLTIDQARYQQIVLPNSSDTSPRVLQFPLVDGSSTDAVGGMWIVDNTASTQGIIVTTAAPLSTQLTIPANKKQLIFSNGKGVFFADDIRITAGTGLTLDGTTLSLTSPVTSTNGGTGFSDGYSAGQLLIGKTNGGLARATLTPGSNITIENGDGTIKINSTASGGTGGLSSITFSTGTSGLTFTPSTLSSTSSPPVTSTTIGGTLVVGNGGTGATTFTAGYLKANGTTAFTTAAKIPAADLDGTVAVANGGTGATTVTGTGTGAANVLSIGPKLTGTTEVAGLKATSGITTNTLSVGNGTGHFAASAIAVKTSTDWCYEGWATSGPVMVLKANLSTDMIEFFYYNAVTGVSTLVGSIANTTTSTNYNTASDYRLKENVENYNTGLSQINALRPVTFTWKDDTSSPRIAGFIAHEAHAVIPAAVSGKKDAVKSDGTIIPQGMDNSFIVPALVSAVQQLSNQVDALNAEIAALKAKVGP